MGTGTFVVVGASKPSQHSMKIAILPKNVECWDGFCCGRDGFRYRTVEPRPANPPSSLRFRCIWVKRLLQAGVALYTRAV